jgi:hypothetical protein
MKQLLMREIYQFGRLSLNVDIDRVNNKSFFGSNNFASHIEEKGIPGKIGNSQLPFERFHDVINFAGRIHFNIDKFKDNFYTPK